MSAFTFTQEEYKAWLKTHHDHLKDYNAFEVANLALACGFSMANLAPDTSEWITASERKLRLWTSPFQYKWLRAHYAQNGFDSDD